MHDQCDGNRATRPLALRSNTLPLSHALYIKESHFLAIVWNRLIPSIVKRLPIEHYTAKAHRKHAVSNKYSSISALSFVVVLIDKGSEVIGI
jgi:hypothetical protein